MFASRIGDRIQDLVDIEQGRLLQQGATVLLAQRREDNSFCDRIHRQLLLEISGSVLSYLISWEKSLSAIIHRPWPFIRACEKLLWLVLYNNFSQALAICTNDRGGPRPGSTGRSWCGTWYWIGRRCPP